MPLAINAPSGNWLTVVDSLGVAQSVGKPSPPVGDSEQVSPPDPIGEPTPSTAFDCAPVGVAMSERCSFPAHDPDFLSAVELKRSADRHTRVEFLR